MSGKTIIIGFIAVLMLASAAYYVGRDAVREEAQPKTAAVVVTMTDEGFSPAEFTIRKGERVDFVNGSATNSYWPASDLHPTHEIYSAFDPQKPIGPGETWSFVFEEVGRWKMHDHLHANIRGEITVTP